MVDMVVMVYKVVKMISIDRRIISYFYEDKRGILLMWLYFFYDDIT